MNLQDFHIQYDYYIKAKQIDNKTLVVTFPETNTIKPSLPKLTKAYFITYDGLEIVSSDKKNKNIICPEYVKRVYVAQDISKVALKYDISEKLILAYNKDDQKIDGKSRVKNLLKKPSSDEQIKLEEKLHNLILKVLNDEEYEVEKDIKQGFDILIESIKE